MHSAFSPEQPCFIVWGLPVEQIHQTIIDTVLTPEQVSERILASSGVVITPRTIWEKARRLGIARKIGRSTFIVAADIPLLLEPEPKMRERASNAAAERSVKAALRMLANQKKKRKTS